MTQHELIGIMNTKMLQALRYRENIDYETEQHGYWHGTYRAYEEMIQLLTMMDIRHINLDAPSVTPID